MIRKPQKLEKQELLGYGLKLLAGRALSEGEVRSKLRRRAAVEADIDAVIGRLHELGVLNDKRFAEGFATARLANQGFGKQRVLSDLAGRRVPRELAARAVENAFEEVDEKALIEQYLERKYRGKNLPALLKEDRHLASAFRRLRTAGFSSGASIDVLKRYSRQADLLHDTPEEDDSEDAAKPED